MVELFRGFPIADVVAALAVVSELALVWIGVAREAFLREADERFAEIFVFDQAAVVALNVFRRVALGACDIRVFAFQGVAGQLVIDLFLRWLPVNQRKIKPVMFKVAAHAIFAAGIFHPEPRVISTVRGKMLRNLLMALETLERRRGGSELVAARALRRAR